jgi:hypothetical protein
MLGPFEYTKKYRWSNVVGVRADNGRRFELNDTILVEVLGGTRHREANLALCERKRPRIEAACRNAQTRLPNDTVIALAKGDFAKGSRPGEGMRLVLAFPDNKTAQQFSGWVYSEGYPERIVFQNTVTLDVLNGDRKRIVQEATDRNGQVKR